MLCETWESLFSKVPWSKSPQLPHRTSEQGGTPGTGGRGLLCRNLQVSHKQSLKRRDTSPGLSHSEFGILPESGPDSPQVGGSRERNQHTFGTAFRPQILPAQDMAWDPRGKCPQWMLAFVEDKGYHQILSWETPTQCIETKFPRQNGCLQTHSLTGLSCTWTSRHCAWHTQCSQQGWGKSLR